MGFYPSKPKAKEQQTQAGGYINDAVIDSAPQIMPTGLSMEMPMCSKIEDEANAFSKKADDNQKRTFTYDAWSNEVASINANNSVLQYTQFDFARLGYQESALLANDGIINNAIGTITNDCLAQWGQIKINRKGKSSDLAGDDLAQKDNEIIEKIQAKLNELGIIEVLTSAITRSLTYGGAGVFFAFGGDQNLKDEIFIKPEILRKNPLIYIKIIEPWLTAPYDVNTSNPLAKDYMEPKQWYISGGELVHGSRIYPLVFFPTMDILKPMFNFYGLSIVQFMQSKVKRAESASDGVADLIFRFKTDIVKTPAITNMSDEEARKRIKLFNKSKNNLGTLLLAPDEDWLQSVASLAGLDRLVAQGFEFIAQSARMPACKLLGITPSGFNSTGEFDLKNYYDVIKSYQDTKIKPLLLKILKIVAYSIQDIDLLDLADIDFEFDFNPIERESKVEQGQYENLSADFLGKMISAGIITNSQAFEEAKARGLFVTSTTNETDDIDLNDPFLGNNQIPSDPAWQELKTPEVEE